jgi:predicted nucleotidyltransferase
MLHGNEEQAMYYPENILEAALVRYPGLISAYLFGSYLEQRAHRESDVDVGVLLDRGTYPTAAERFEARLDLLSLLEHALAPRHPDVVILNDAPPGLAARIVTTGKRVTCADSESDHAFVRDSQLRAADLEPFLRRMRDIKLRTILGHR